MLTHFRPALVILGILTLLTGVIYPLAITSLAQIAMPYAANGSLVRKGGVAVGSVLIGQQFSTERYFHGRPSATSAPDPKDETKTVDAPYNAGNSAGSNLGPLSKKLIERVQADSDALRKSTGAVIAPADAVTASASGLDPHIAPAFAALQISRIAAARRVPEARVSQVLQSHIEPPLLGIFGEPRVNVLALNLALDSLVPPGSG